MKSEKQKFNQQFGISFKEKKNKNYILIHAVSVGEITAVVPIVKELKKILNEEILISTSTLTGFKMALKYFRKEYIIFAPFDFFFVIKKFLKHIRPKVLCMIETEIWPNLLYYANKEKIPILMINGRIYKKDFFRYRILSFFFKKVLLNFTFCAMQSIEDKKRIIKIGALAEKVKVIGNSKFDFLPSEVFPLFEKINSLQIIVAGSTHSSENKIILETYKEIKERHKNLVLIIAPRHFNCIPVIEKYCKKLSLKYDFRTKIHRLSYNLDVVILNTIGELPKAYKIADIVFVGGSLVPRGGHNIMEPAILSKPIIFGPYMENFQQARNLFLSNFAAREVKNKSQLKEKILYLLDNQIERNRLGTNAFKVVQQNKGAALKYAYLIKETYEKN